MPTNFYIDVERAGFDRAMKVFDRESRRLTGALRRASRFSTEREKKRRKGIKSRRRYRQEDFHPISVCALQMKEGETAQLRIPTSAPRRIVASKPTAEDQRPAAAITAQRTERTEGVLILVEFASNPLELSVLKDNDKDLLRFPFGMRDPEDETIFAAGERECYEETFFGLDVRPKLAKDNLLGEILVSSDHVVYVFLLRMPGDTPIAPGEEQEAAFRVPVQLVDKYVERGLFPQTHVAAWALYKKKTAERR